MGIKEGTEEEPIDKSAQEPDIFGKYKPDLVIQETEDKFNTTAKKKYLVKTEPQKEVDKDVGKKKEKAFSLGLP